ncbi:YgjV family protein [Cellulomonas sp. Root137]|uniref:YgjV family protein n=1 Tax=Cellulomonas sp. Root137 TaxID=1736459 RepID=UPI0006FAE0ED|nr:YgjV family protein [Cellulomonas sp. Root137]KQY46636.1 hypothetical protein ASD18_04225 [Cellulomonas sp. Root137]KRD43785.1 hypothetical protein ASE38_06180 [Cellulomonas sp. Root930]
MVWWEIVGWIGSLLVIISLTQARVLRFRVINLLGAVIATAYNVVIEIWPFAVMNGVIAIIDVYWLVRLQRERHDALVYGVLEVPSDDAVLQHLLESHAPDIARFHPGFSAVDPAPSASFVVVRGDELVGAVVVRSAGDGVGRVDLDYVTPRYRDFTPGEFVYRDSGVFASHGFRRLVVGGSPATEARAYLERVGFRPTADGWEREVPTAA